MLTPLGALVHWVRERELIRVQKDRGEPFPWTDDKILRTYRFCNVRREDDRVTVWIAKNIREPYADHHHLWFMLCTARMINWPHTLGLLIGDPTRPPEERIYPNAWPDSASFSPSAMADGLEDVASMGKAFTGAYIIPSPGKGEKKPRWMAQWVLGNLWKARARFETHFSRNPSLRSTHNLLTTFDCWGNFLAYQAIIDMRHTSLLSEVPDRNTWCAAGPGTIRGLNRLAGRPLIAPLTQERALLEIQSLQPVVCRETGMDFELYEITGILCETDKYLRVMNGEGEPRARYVPGRGA